MWIRPTVLLLVWLFPYSLELPSKSTSGQAENDREVRRIPTSDFSKRDPTTQIDNSTIDQKFERPVLEANYTQSDEGAIHVCDATSAPGRENIYCYGKLLEAVMAVQLHSDSKTFVDRPIRKNKTGNQIYEAFLQQFPQSVSDIKKEGLEKFVDENFEREGAELRKCQLNDWTENPPALAEIYDATLRKFALQLNAIWKELCREVDVKVKDEPERYSLIYVPNQFIAPGGRFREFYYWDAYWIIKGLLASGMYETTKGMLRNFRHIVDTIGFIPNGGRVYYLQRSQPPLFAAMVYEYYAATLDSNLIREMLPSLEAEHSFWKQNRSVNVEINGTTYQMFQYRTPANVPRPESFREDVITAARFPSINEKREFWQNIGSAAESGWDFSSRWFADPQNFSSIETKNIVPVDLNAFLCYNLNIIAFLHGQIGNDNKQFKWMQEYVQFRDDFRNVFYVRRGKGWYDYNLRTKSHNLHFYPSMAVPLFTGCYDRLATTEANELYNQMADMGAFDFVGGIPTSLERQSNQQWDFPNGWSPLNHMVIEGLRKSGNVRMQRKAFTLAEKWVTANYHVFAADRAMWEKYNVASGAPRGGGGGEYDVQAGFGWTNGVVLDLLVSFGDRMRYVSDVVDGNMRRTGDIVNSTPNIYGNLMGIVGSLIIRHFFTQ